MGLSKSCAGISDGIIMRSPKAYLGINLAGVFTLLGYLLCLHNSILFYLTLKLLTSLIFILTPNSLSASPGRKLGVFLSCVFTKIRTYLIGYPACLYTSARIRSMNVPPIPNKKNRPTSCGANRGIFAVIRLTELGIVSQIHRNSVALPHYSNNIRIIFVASSDRKETHCISITRT